MTLLRNQNLFYIQDKKFTYFEKKVISIKILRVKYGILFIGRLKAIKNTKRFFLQFIFYIKLFYISF